MVRRSVGAAALLLCLLLVAVLLLHHSNHQDLHPLPRPPGIYDPFAESTEDAEQASTRRLFAYLTDPELPCQQLQSFTGRRRRRDDHRDVHVVCMDAQHAPRPGQCLVYSVSVPHRWSLDREMVRRGCEVHAFDPTLREYAERVDSFGVHFHRVGLDAFSGRTQDGWVVRTLLDLKQSLGHTAVMLDYLRVDMADAEQRWLQGGDLEGLDTVRQLSIRLQLLLTVGGVRDDLNTLKLIRDVGFRLVHAQPSRQPEHVFEVVGVKGNVSDVYDLLWVKAPSHTTV